MSERITLNQSSRHATARASVTVEADPIHHDFDEKALGGGPAEALRDAIINGIRSITEKASKATIARRRKKNPGASDRLFNDTGHLAQHIELRPHGDTWTITAPPDRLDATSVPDVGALERMLNRLAELVPAIRNPLDVPAVRAAIEKTITKLISVGRR